MSRKTYIPERGHIIHVNLGNTSGSREFDGPHFALVISKGELNRKTGLCVVIPTTSRSHPELAGLAIALPPLDGLQRDGWALIHHVRSIDFRERSASLAAKLDLTNADHALFIDDLVDRLFSMVD